MHVANAITMYGLLVQEQILRPHYCVPAMVGCHLFRLGRRHKKKNYVPIKSVLDEALTGHAFHGCPMKSQNPKNGKLVFNHKMDFMSVTQPETSKLDAYYVLMFIREYQRDMQQLQLPGQLKTWCLKNMSTATDSQHRLEFIRI